MKNKVFLLFAMFTALIMLAVVIPGGARAEITITEVLKHPWQKSTRGCDFKTIIEEMQLEAKPVELVIDIGTSFKKEVWYVLESKYFPREYNDHEIVVKGCLVSWHSKKVKYSAVGKKYTEYEIKLGSYTQEEFRLNMGYNSEGFQQILPLYLDIDIELDTRNVEEEVLEELTKGKRPVIMEGTFYPKAYGRKGGHYPETPADIYKLVLRIIPRTINGHPAQR